MDKHFMAIAAIGVIVIGIVGLGTGTALIIYTGDAAAGAACIGIASASLGALAGVLAAPKVIGAITDPASLNQPAGQ